MADEHHHAGQEAGGCDEANQGLEEEQHCDSP
jgi:hypothetical protein